MKRYQALILGAVISTGSFVLGMNSVTPVKIIEGPFVVKPKQLSEYEDKLVQDVIDEYADLVDKKIQYQQEELDLRGSDILPTIKRANDSLISIRGLEVRAACQIYDLYEQRQSVDDLQYGSEEQIKLQAVHNICGEQGVFL
ncbi:hypothetical protein phiAS5_ORF0082 [Aeromonas phage phiAS5]|uniref:Uncharacterized protein n=1 Tax=Aeromonas phage phiAS5 TaxID=879630 RepID=E1A2H9_9CAUD|nr:hypothetical protein phiAS5_ORF0082 [Aeromonas phage phiAS5]ADM79925.1 hypothetical protein phiAS5_ORF0082 [Aeromonas phage phiAS5]BES53303.1 hypothetical protein [Aeromonas phage phiWae14]